MVQNLISSRIITGALIERRGIAAGKRVAVHIMVRMYSCPDFDLGSRPTQSINKRSNGSRITGMWCKGAMGSFWFGLPTDWQAPHKRQKLDTADFNPGQ